MSELDNIINNIELTAREANLLQYKIAIELNRLEGDGLDDSYCYQILLQIHYKLLKLPCVQESIERRKNKKVT